MFRAAYRRFADGHEALVGNETVCVVNGGNCESPGTAVVSVRWWEIKNLTSGTPSIVQAATYQPDTTQRWMGSAAMDLQGNIALCYSAASSAVVPGLRCTGRLTADPVNTMSQGESTMFAGAGSQSATSNRWGDYSDLTIDPVDDCTFWYTSEYYPTGSTQFNWRTRVVSFKFPGCTAGPHGTAHFTVTQCTTGTPVANATVTIDGNNYGTTNASGVLDATLVPGSHAWSVAKTGWSSGSGNVSITDGSTTPVSQCLNSGTAHFVVVNCSTSSPVSGATVTVGGTVMGQTNSSGVLDVPLAPGQYGWVVTRPNYAQSQGSVTIANATTTPVNACLSPTCTEQTSFSEWWDTTTPPALPAGWTTQVVQGPAPAWVTSNSGTLTPVADSAPNSAFIDDPSVVSDKVLVSPSIAVASQTAQLSFRHRAAFESGWDGGVLEIKIGGGSFTDIVAAGGSFTTGGYTATLNSGSPLAGRQAWTGAVGTASNFTTVAVTLPASAAGQNVQFRWREGSDVSVAGSGWRIDSVTLNDCLPTRRRLHRRRLRQVQTPIPSPSPDAVSPPEVPTPSPTPTDRQHIANANPNLDRSDRPPDVVRHDVRAISGGTATPLSGVTYTARAGKINGANPTTFRYWVKVNATAGANTVS